MLKRALLAVMLLAGLVMVSAPASAYVALVLCDDGFTYNGSNTPEITVGPSDTFVLYWVIACDETFTTAGVDISISFDPDLETLTTTVNPVNTTGSDFVWDGFISKNQGSNVTGLVEYQGTKGLGTSITKGPGQYLLGTVEFHCEAPGTETKTVAGSLMPAMGPGDLFTVKVGCVVNQTAIPEPATLLLLGSGLVFGGFAYRRRR